VARLEALLAAEGLVVAGSKRRARLSPVVSKLRVQRAALARLVAALAIPGDGEAEGFDAEAAAGAADARWSRKAADREARLGEAG
jgi:hypothetical protein